MGNYIKNNIDYIHKKAGNATGFSAPLNYFNNLEDALTAKLSEENFTKENSFDVPGAYFNNLEDLILAKVVSTEKDTKVISFKERILKMIPLAAAASVALFIGLNSFAFNTTEELTLDAISDDEIALWLDYNSLSSNEIAFVLEETMLDENEFYFSKIKDETIEDYINNSIDYTYLLNEIN